MDRTTQKRLTIAHKVWFHDAQDLYEMQIGSTRTWAPNTGVVDKNIDHLMLFSGN